MVECWTPTKNRQKDKILLTYNAALKHYIENAIISFDDVMKSSSQEDLMTTIISKVHPYAIIKPKEGAKDQRWSTYVKDELSSSGRRKILRKTKKDILEYLFEYYGLPKDSGSKKHTLGKVFQEWTEYKEGFVKSVNKRKSLSPTTINRYRRDYSKCLAGTTLDKTPIKSITSIQIENTFKDIISKLNLSEYFVDNLLGYLNMAFNYAVRMRYIEKNEFLFVDKTLVLSLVPSKPPKNDSERVLTAKELQALYEAVRSHEEHHPNYLPDYAIELAILTGMRVGEISALHWTDIRDGAIHIDFSEHRNDYSDHSELVIDEPKNLKHRIFPLNEAIEKLLSRIMSLGINGEFVFMNSDGRRCTGHDISCACARRAGEAGIKKTSIHCIRRTVASEMRKQFSIKLVSNLLGHLEETDEGYYNYDNSEFAEKKAASEHLYSNVLKFDANKKIAEAL